jgi:hypothetical protein
MSNKARRLRSAAFEAQSGRCFYCAQPMYLDDPKRFALCFGLTLGHARLFRCTAEHLLPAQNGGPMTAANIVAACLFCNSRRHRRRNVPNPEQYRTFIGKRLAAGRWHLRGQMPNQALHSRLTFEFKEGHAYVLDYEDYH